MGRNAKSDWKVLPSPTRDYFEDRCKEYWSKNEEAFQIALTGVLECDQAQAAMVKVIDYCNDLEQIILELEMDQEEHSNA